MHTLLEEINSPSLIEGPVTPATTLEVSKGSLFVSAPYSESVSFTPLVAGHYNSRVPFAIRDFASSDFDVLWRIDQDCFPAGISYSRAELRSYIRRPGSITLVVVEVPPDSDQKHSPLLPSRHAGFIVAEAGRRSGHIITIDVIASARHSGVGSLLLRTAEDRLRAARCSSVELETAVDNSAALSFYKRHSYSVIKTFPRYYSNGVDALVLQKYLI